MFCLYGSGIHTDVYLSGHSTDIWYLKWEKYKQKGTVEEKPITCAKAHALE